MKKIIAILAILATTQSLSVEYNSHSTGLAQASSRYRPLPPPTCTPSWWGKYKKSYCHCKNTYTKTDQAINQKICIETIQTRYTSCKDNKDFNSLDCTPPPPPPPPSNRCNNRKLNSFKRSVNGCKNRFKTWATWNNRKTCINGLKRRYSKCLRRWRPSYGRRPPKPDPCPINKLNNFKNAVKGCRNRFRGRGNAARRNNCIKNKKNQFKVCLSKWNPSTGGSCPNNGGTWHYHNDWRQDHADYLVFHGQHIDITHIDDETFEGLCDEYLYKLEHTQDHHEYVLLKHEYLDFVHEYQQSHSGCHWESVPVW